MPDAGCVAVWCNPGVGTVDAISWRYGIRGLNVAVRIKTIGAQTKIRIVGNCLHLSDGSPLVADASSASSIRMCLTPVDAWCVTRRSHGAFTQIFLHRRRIRFQQITRSRKFDRSQNPAPAHQFGSVAAQVLYLSR